MQTVFIVAVVSLIWVAFGYSWAFSTEYADSGNPLACVIGGFDKCFLHGIGLEAIMPTGIPELTFAMFQCMFALITPALILGAFAERVKFSGYVLFTVLWVIIAYLPMARLGIGVVVSCRRWEPSTLRVVPWFISMPV